MMSSVIVLHALCVPGVFVPAGAGVGPGGVGPGGAGPGAALFPGTHVLFHLDVCQQTKMVPNEIQSVCDLKYFER